MSNVEDRLNTIRLPMVKLVNDLRQVGGFLPVLGFYPLIKLTVTI